MDRSRFVEACLALATPLELSESQLNAFEAFEDALYRQNEVMNLTRIAKEECWLRHFVDSVLFQDLIPANSVALDIGTGPGFPAWPLACARPDLHVVGLDSSGKMLGFLRANFLPNLKVVLNRAEDWAERDAFDFVTGRALAPLGIQLELSAHLCKIGGIVGPMRSSSEFEEVRKDVSRLGLELWKVEERMLPGTDIVRIMPLYRKAALTPARYPRTWAEMKKRPLI